MNGRFWGIKKSFLLKAHAVLSFLLFVAFVFLSIYLFKKPTLWFYSFSLFLGDFEIFKSILFKLDSAFYLGVLLLGIGISGFVFLYTNTMFFAPFYISLAFIMASLMTAVVCGQRFHLTIAFSLIFVTLYAFLWTKNLITLPIFIAFITPFLILLILEIILNLKRRS